MPVIEFKNIAKNFGKLRANDDVSFSIEENSVHCILGENGAGKSTLMKILYGVYQPDSGELVIKGKRTSFRSPHDAIESGVAMVWQHFMLIEDFTVLENVILGNEPVKGLSIDFRIALKKVNELIKKFNLGLNPDDKVESLSIASQQKIELLKILFRDPDIIIFDEPTAVLSPVEVIEFFKIVELLREAGKTILLITHKLREVMEVAMRVSVLRSGRLVYEAGMDEFDMESLSKAIIGDSTYEIAAESKTESDIPEKNLVTLRNVFSDSKTHGKLNGLDLSINSGEILGICGVEGNGQNDIVDLLLGLSSAKSGEVSFNFDKLSVVPDDRLKKGMITEYNIGENLIVRRKGFERAGKKKLLNISEVLIKSYDIKTPSYSTPMGNLSGGNQQKAIVAREIEFKSELIIFSHPTRGVDIKSSLFIHDEITHARNSGRGVLLISSDLDELFVLSDRLAVIYNGRIVKLYPPDMLKSRLQNVNEFSIEIGKLMIGAAVE